MDAIIWILLPLTVAAGSAILSVYMTNARSEVAVAKERETLAAVKAQLACQEQAFQDKLRATEEAAHRKAFDQFLTDFRVEERRYIRENKSHLFTRKSVIMQERLYFRNIPLSNWVEHEMKLEEGTDLRLASARTASVFSSQALAEQSKHAPKFLTQ